MGTDAEAQQLQHSILGSGPISLAALHTLSPCGSEAALDEEVRMAELVSRRPTTIWGEAAARTETDYLEIIQDLMCEMNRKGFEFCHELTASPYHPEQTLRHEDEGRRGLSSAPRDRMGAECRLNECRLK